MRQCGWAAASPKPTAISPGCRMAATSSSGPTAAAHITYGNAVVAQRYDSAGNQVGGELKISPFNNGTQDAPAVTTLSNGNIAVALVDFLSGRYDIYVRIYDPSLGLVRT